MMMLFAVRLSLILMMMERGLFIVKHSVLVSKMKIVFYLVVVMDLDLVIDS